MQDLGPVGSKEGPPVLYNWSLFWHLGPLAPWLVLLPLLLLKGNRDRRAWAVLLPLAVVLIPVLALSTAATLLMDWGGYALGAFPAGLALSLAVVWLLAHRLARFGRAGAFGLAAAVVFGVGLAMAAASRAGVAAMIGHTVVHTTCGLILLTALALAGFFCRRRFTTRRFSLWTLLWCLVPPLGLAICLAGFGLLAAVAMQGAGGDGLDFLFVALAGILGVGLATGLLLALILLSFLALIFNNRLFRERFDALFRLPAAGPSGGPAASDVPPLPQ